MVSQNTGWDAPNVAISDPYDRRTYTRQFTGVLGQRAHNALSLWVDAIAQPCALASVVPTMRLFEWDKGAARFFLRQPTGNE